MVTQLYEYASNLYVCDHQYLPRHMEECAALDRDEASINEMRNALLKGPLLAIEIENSYLDKVESYDKRCAQYLEEGRKQAQLTKFPKSVKRYISSFLGNKADNEDSTSDAKLQEVAVRSPVEGEPATLREICQMRRKQEATAQHLQAEQKNAKAENDRLRARAEVASKTMISHLQSVPSAPQVLSLCSDLSAHLEKLSDPAYSAYDYAAELEKYGERFRLIVGFQPAQTPIANTSSSDSKLSDAKAILTFSGSSLFDATAKKINADAGSPNPQSPKAVQPAPRTTPAAGVSS